MPTTEDSPIDGQFAFNSKDELCVVTGLRRWQPGAEVHSTVSREVALLSASGRTQYVCFEDDSQWLHFLAGHHVEVSWRERPLQDHQRAFNTFRVGTFVLQKAFPRRTRRKLSAPS